jgi:PAS domain-containing protein
MPDDGRESSARLSLIVETQREIAAAGNDLQMVMQLVAERSQAITGADGAMVNLIERAELLSGELMRGQRQPFQAEARLVRKDGEGVWAHVSAALECDQHGAPASVVAIRLRATS